jgi:TonB-dependent SusC/RagA subfamily outer membrane receptor
MKCFLTIVLCFSFSLIFAQDFKSEWREVIQFELDGKITSAHDKVNEIYKKAKRKNFEDQIIKCFFYQSKFLQVRNENYHSIVIKNLQTEIDESKGSKKAILNSIYASILESYYQNNRYAINKSTDLATNESVDFKTWTGNDFEKEIDLTYASLLKDENELRNTGIEKFSSILEISPYTDAAKMNVYDFLQPKVITHYFKNLYVLSDEKYQDLVKKLITTSEVFVQANMDTLSIENLKKGIQILQNNEKYGLKNNLETVHTLQYNRMQLFSKIIADKENYFIELSLLEKKVKSNYLRQDIKVDFAKYYASLTSKESKKNYYPEVLSMIDTILNQRENPNAKANAESLKERILKKQLTLNIPSEIYPQQNYRAFVEFKNIDSLQVSYYKIPIGILKKIDIGDRYYRTSQNKQLDRDSIVFSYIEKNEPLNSVVKTLPNKTDYFEYSTELVMEPLEVGAYLLFFETKNNRNNPKKAFAYKTLQVSNINYVQERESNNDVFHLLHRKTGKPIENAIIKNNESTQKTNQNGMAEFRLSDQESDLYSEVLFVKDIDTLFTSYYKSKKKTNETDEKFEALANVFFDRAIYRPGQKVFFKGYLFQNKNNVKSVVPYLTVTVIINNANSEEVKKFDIQTNEFGSFTGEYEIPKNVFTGNFFITIEKPDNYEADTKYYTKKEDEHSFWDHVDFNGSREFRFQVEEYKRPTFEITFDAIKENFTIGDSISVKGNAKTFAGSNLTNAKVSYSLEQNVQLKKGNFNKDENKINKEILTDEKGNFTLNLNASKAGLSNEEIALMTFYINVSITDVNGETRTANTSIKVGAEMLQLNAIISPILIQGKKNTLKIKATTLNDFPINAKGTIAFVQLSQPNFLIKRVRFPELNSIDKDLFTKLFPFEAYDEKATAVEEKIVKTMTFDTEKSTEIDMAFLDNFDTTNYKIKLEAQDQNGNTIHTENDFSLTTNDKKATDESLFVVQQIESKSNDFVFEIKSVLPDLYVTTRMYDDNQKISERVVQLKNGLATVKIPKQGNDKTDLNFHFSTLWENTYFEEELSISKEEIKTQLDFEIVSMRNKIEPGSLENWSFVLKNSKLQAEVVASMYDMSLDQFATSNWKINNFYNRKTRPQIIYNYNDWYSNTIRFTNLYFNSEYYPTNVADPKINWFGFYFNNQNKHFNNQYLKKVKSNALIPANAKSVYGIVTEGDLPLPGVSVVVKGTSRETQTDFDGRYKIEMAPGEILVFSYLGFENKSAVFSNEKQINIQLKEADAMFLSSVVVQVSSETKTLHTGTSSIIVADNAVYDSDGNDDFNYYRGNIYTKNVSVLESLQGQSPGLNFIASSGSPGSAKFNGFIRGASSINGNTDPLLVVDGIPVTAEEFRKLNQQDIQSVTVLRDASGIAIYGNRAKNGVIIITTKNEMKALEQVKTRTNFNETAFFYPNLTTDAKGNISFSFTSPESLTKWRLRLFGHNKKAETGYFQTDIISQKDVMVMPNMPRFVREKDVINLTTKIVNMTNEIKTGNAVLLLFDAATNTAIDSISMNSKNLKVFTCKPKESVVVDWTITVPEGVQGLRYKVMAKSGSTSDGEENILPVLTDKILITESIPIWVKGNTKREFTLHNLKNNTSSTLQNHTLTFEYTSNPVWMALQSLPYLMAYEHECSEQVFAKYFANSLATKIIASNPKIERLFQKWHDEKLGESRLKMNEELKSIILAETPWLLDAESDDEKNKRLAVLMNLSTLKENNAETYKKLEEKMLPSGGFPWFNGGTENRFISQYILSGIGRLNALFPEDSLKYKSIVSKGIPNLDRQFVSHYSKKEKIVRPSTLNLNYLYTRSFYLKNYTIPTKVNALIQLQLKQCKEDWLTYSLYEKGILALVLHRFNEKDFAKKIITSLKETASSNEEIGMHWIENKSNSNWFQSNIATQALLIEAFAEIDQKKEIIDAMKVWLIKNKQTSRWPTTKSTTEAVFALMNQGTDWISLKENTKISIGDEKLITKKLLRKDDEQQTGYLKIQYNAEEISSKMATVSIENKTSAQGFGGYYWQYFESLENIKKDSTRTISIDKKLYKKASSGKGFELIELNKETLKVGDLITVRLIIKTESDLEFVHLKDLRASALEPIDVTSTYEWKGNFSYYKSSKDVSTNFFFDRLNKGTYVLEYDLRITNKGDFNNGISTLQSMYAPEFSAHSGNSKISIKQ